MEKKDVIRTVETLADRWKNQKIEVLTDEPMSSHTSFKAGGRAAALASAASEEELRQILEDAAGCRVPVLLLGNGSNTLFRDSGYPGVVVKLSAQGFGSAQNLGGGRIRCGAAMLLSSLAKYILSASLTGFEFASGLPGSLGGAVFMNAGAYGGEMKDVLVSVRAVSPDGRTVREFSAEELQLGYRRSILAENGYIVTEAVLQLAPGNREEIAGKMKELTEQRNRKQPVQYPSAGSTFKRPEGYFAGKLIEDAGLKGVSVGGAQVSVLHSGFIINTGGATATDILDLIALVQNTVYEKSGVKLEPEVRIVG
ncbi:MAG: UDP-N-acetylmuramate dehydrogenase [Firmicutes bacterium]|nr:UDP-N-acetylmuramate dehydrogenase [Bacillota bacterium]